MFVAAILPRMTRIPAEAAASKSFRERTADEIEVFTLANSNLKCNAGV
jgi:hypothetical protein